MASVNNDVSSQSERRFSRSKDLDRKPYTLRFLDDPRQRSAKELVRTRFPRPSESAEGEVVGFPRPLTALPGDHELWAREVGGRGGFKAKRAPATCCDPAENAWARSPRGLASAGESRTLFRLACAWPFRPTSCDHLSPTRPAATPRSRCPPRPLHLSSSWSFGNDLSHERDSPRKRGELHVPV